MARVLAISSHVARGLVGLTATVPALQWLGHEVWALPTILLASRPGLGRMVRHAMPAPDLAAMLGALEQDGCWPKLDAVFVGYFADPQAVAVVAEAVARIKAANPEVRVVVDPVLGDAGRLYVPEPTAQAVCRELVPLADIATPDLFELGWLTQSHHADLGEIGAAARRLGPATVVVTSASQTAAGVATLMVTRSSQVARLAPLRAGLPNGPGDLFAGLLLGHLLNGQTEEAALDASLEHLDRVLAASVGCDVLQLSALRG
jgi:pyridoxine kinase